MNYYNQIKEELINNEIYKVAKDYSKNRSDLNTYFNVGKLLVEAQGGEKRAGYGNSLIKEYSRRLTLELNKKYSETNLKYMRQFYLLFEKSQAVPDQLTWSHYVELLKLNNSERNLRICVNFIYSLKMRFGNQWLPNYNGALVLMSLKNNDEIEFYISQIII